MLSPKGKEDAQYFAQSKLGHRLTTADKSQQPSPRTAKVHPGWDLISPGAVLTGTVGVPIDSHTAQLCNEMLQLYFSKLI